VLLAGVEPDRAIEGALGVLLVAAALIFAAVVLLRRWRARRAAKQVVPPVPALARFADVETTDPSVFGGGAIAARTRRRRDDVVYGYPAAVEEFRDANSAASWCTLSVSLPGRVPFLVLDHWQAVGQPGVPQAAPLRPRLGDSAFDSAYVIGVQDADVASRVLGPGARTVLLETPVQRLVLQGSIVMVRTFDGDELSDALVERLGAVVARFLAATPSFVQTSMVVSGARRPDAPLPEGLYGPAAD